MSRTANATTTTGRTQRIKFHFRAGKLRNIAITFGTACTSRNRGGREALPRRISLVGITRHPRRLVATVGR